VKQCSIATLALVALLAAGAGTTERAEETDDGFAKRLFAGKLDKDKSYACFVRVYDQPHLNRHPLQKVSAMKLLITAEKAEDAPGLRYSFRLGVKFTKRPGDFDSSGDCSHAELEPGKDNKSRLGCGVDCEGGGISIKLKPDNQATLVRLERIRIWQNNKPDEEGLDLSGGADDRIFRLDRAKLEQYQPLVSDRKELAAMRHK
jgi:hypothetical protein